MLLAGVAGGLAIAGLALLLLELTRPAPAPGRPPRGRIAVSGRTRKRLLIAAGTAILTFALTRWPVATVAAALAVLFLPGITSSRSAQHRP